MNDISRDELARAKRSYKQKLNRCYSRVDRNGEPIQMRLTFEEWCYIWEESGHWGEWGTTKGKYCMSRYDDLGHYEVDNVFIQLHSANSAEEGHRRTGANNPNFGKTKPPPTPEEMAKYIANGKRVASMPHICPHCGKEGIGQVMFRWHFDNCQHKENNHE